MKAICTRCQGSGLEPHIETQTVNLNQYWKCNKCGMVSNFEPQEHKCKFEKDPLRQLPVKKPKGMTKPNKPQTEEIKKDVTISEEMEKETIRNIEITYQRWSVGDIATTRVSINSGEVEVTSEEAQMIINCLSSYVKQNTNTT